MAAPAAGSPQARATAAARARARATPAPANQRPERRRKPRPPRGVRSSRARPIPSRGVGGAGDGAQAQNPRESGAPRLNSASRELCSLFFLNLETFTFRLSGFVSRLLMEEMPVVDVSRWDESTCGCTLCQHPHCWETHRRIERGRPRLLREQPSPGRVLTENEDELPTLTITNFPSYCFLAKGVSRPTFSALSLFKSHPFFSFLSENLEQNKLNYYLEGSLEDVNFPKYNSPKDSLVSYAHQHAMHPAAKLTVQNLNETALPKSLDTGNLVVMWVPNVQQKNQKLGSQMVSDLSHVSQKQVSEMKSRKLILGQEYRCVELSKNKKKSNKSPIGGQLYQAHFAPHQQTATPKTSPREAAKLDPSSAGWALPPLCGTLASGSSAEEREARAPRKSKVDPLDRTLGKLLKEHPAQQEGHRGAFLRSMEKMTLSGNRVTLQDPKEDLWTSLKKKPMVEHLISFGDSPHPPLGGSDRSKCSSWKGKNQLGIWGQQMTMQEEAQRAQRPSRLKIRNLNLQMVKVRQALQGAWEVTNPPSSPLTTSPMQSKMSSVLEVDNAMLASPDPGRADLPSRDETES
ncbi:uncharacterized protein C9orf43 homolog [Tachyglossus aculeatus]|uniref:uncharacterized protein C9orf43 homolog n=1 Tax=Tachyglossus aculeatus TaxID=9261 RepID=UPI0018F75102|nr:uncharacterized protein C9orf43 homolog [Tachyglossus aculeatus]